LADGTTRYSDAGEPNGTAGVRIFNAIEHHDLLNQLVIVIRYFGGIKLGVGLLGKAYYSAASKVLNESEIKTKNLFQKIFITSDITLNSHIHRILSSHHSIILNSEFLSEARFECLAIVADMKTIYQKMTETSKNKIKITLTSDFLYR
jgi:putative IMPACT (imprinted ancient) family translation regulator